MSRSVRKHAKDKALQKGKHIVFQVLNFRCFFAVRFRGGVLLIRLTTGTGLTASPPWKSHPMLETHTLKKERGGLIFGLITTFDDREPI